MFTHIHYMSVNLVDLNDKGQGELHTRTGHVGPEGEQRNSFTIFLTSALDVGGWSPRYSCSTPGEEIQCPLRKRLGGPWASLDGCRKSRPPTGIRSLDHPTYSESLYRLCYPGLPTWWTYNLFSSQRLMT
jgi:hypothetical protein